MKSNEQNTDCNWTDGFALDLAPVLSPLVRRHSCGGAATSAFAGSGLPSWSAAETCVSC